MQLYLSLTFHRDATPGAIGKIARDQGINAYVVYQSNLERKASVSNSTESINKIKEVIETSSMTEHELGTPSRANGTLAEDLEEWRNTLRACQAIHSRSATSRIYYSS